MDNCIVVFEEDQIHVSVGVESESSKSGIVFSRIIDANENFSENQDLIKKELTEFLQKHCCCEAVINQAIASLLDKFQKAVVLV